MVIAVVGQRLRDSRKAGGAGVLIAPRWFAGRDKLPLATCLCVGTSQALVAIDLSGNCIFQSVFWEFVITAAFPGGDANCNGVIDIVGLGD